MSSDDRPTDDDDSAAEPLDEKPAAAVPLASASPPAAPRAAQSPPPIAADIVVPSLAARDDLPLLELDTDDDETPPIAPAVQPKTPAPPAPKPAGHGHAAAPAATTPTAASIAAVARSNAAPNRASLSPLIVRLLQAARAANASDLHIKSNEIPLLRVAGGLREVEGEQPLKAEDAEAGLLTLLSDAQRERFLSTNDLDFCFDGGAELGRFRTNFLRQFRGMDGIFRLISAQVPSFEELKMPPAVKKFTEYKQGIVLITGPKGCGKTTTLAAMVDLINSTRAEHIITIEDPIEFVHPCKMGHVNQREVGSHTKEFANALRAALREAPDVIMVGEMRDLETTSLAITAAETGHLVFATLHTPDAIRTIDRVLDVFPPKEQGQIRSMISESMRGIISQLLLPSVDGKSQELAVEILVNTTAIGNLIREEKTYQLRGIMQTGKRLGMQLMDDSLLELARAGKIHKEEAVAVSSEQARVKKELGL
ncbi:MAG: PilT/PilU family type 4a pilus ATPase [Planctomycetia bacterium]|nr:PilT/PilU family type 4a pilus ATPase [Planctomycetia bacterium]